MSISLSYPDVSPSLNLNLSRTKRLDPRITFTRSSTGTYVDRNGIIQSAGINVPRFTHDVTTGNSLGLLVEEARTNLVVRSEEFDNASWIKSTATISSNATTSPNNTLTADKLILDNGQPGGFIAQDTSFVSGTTYTASCYAKASEANDFRFLFQSGAFGSNLTAVFNLTTGVVSSFSTNSANIIPLTNGWFYCTATATATATISSRVQYRAAYSGDGTSGIFIWGAQLEAGPFPTSYIPTTGTTVTRSADIATIAGGNFSNWYRQDEGTIFCIYTLNANTTESLFPTTYVVSDNTFNNCMYGQHRTIDKRRIAVVRVGGTAEASIQGVNNNYTYGTISKMCNSFKVNDIAFATNVDNTVLTDTSSAIPTVDRFSLGSPTIIGGSNSYTNGTIESIVFWPYKISNSIIESITK